jgi:guanosine-diphosphatase
MDWKYRCVSLLSVNLRADLELVVQFKSTPQDSKSSEPTTDVSLSIQPSLAAIFPGKPFLPTKTSKCTPPSDRPPIQYALMLDAGSTGSRIHVYRFSFCSSTVPTLEDELFVQVKPGLSSFGDDPEGAAESLDELMKAAEETVPEEWRCKTPIAVKATAGLRLLGEEKSGKILKEVEKRIKKGGWKVNVVEVMDGKDEGWYELVFFLLLTHICLGVFAWITVNFLLGRLGLTPRNKGGSVAIMDLGGASTQVVFEPRTPTKHPAHRAVVNFDNREHVLYQHSYLGYGLMQARKRITEPKSEFERGAAAAVQDTIDEDLSNPCLPDPKKPQHKTTYETCSAHTLSQGLFNATAPCPEAPCGFDGVHMPPLDSEFEGDIVAFSYFYDRFSELELPLKLTVSEIRKWAERVCLHDDEPLPAGKSSLARKIKAVAEENPHFCLDMTYISGLLEGYGLGGGRTVRVAKKVEGVETGWYVSTVSVIEESLESTDVIVRFLGAWERVSRWLMGCSLARPGTSGSTRRASGDDTHFVVR